MGKFKVGDKVRIRESLKLGGEFPSVNASMLAYQGSIDVIAQVDIVFGIDIYRLENIGYSWSERMLEAVDNRLKVVLDDGAYIPLRAHKDDAGLDLYSREDKYIHPGEFECFDTGVHVAVPVGCVGLITSKSGLMARGITSRGTIDSGYTGSIKAILYNSSEEGYAVHKGDKITQLVILPCLCPEIEIVEALGFTDRGDDGFGSTGR